MNKKTTNTIILLLIITIFQTICTPILSYANDETTYKHASVAPGYSNKGKFEVSTTLTQLTIPSQIDGEEVKKITKIENKNGQSITSITFPSGLTDIGICSNLGLVTVNIPNSVEKIGTLANNELTTINLPTSLTELPNLSNNELTQINIPTSITKIVDSALAGNKLYSINIPNSVTQIGSGAFVNNNLQTVQLPNSVERVGSSAFANNKLKTLTLSNSLESIGSMAFSQNDLQTVEIPASVKTIEQGAFSHNKLESIKISNSVETIEPSVFSNNNLKIVEIPSSVKFIGTQCFDGNENLSSIIIRSKDVKIARGAIYVPQENKDSFVIYGYTGTSAEEYANSAGVKFVDLDSISDDPTNPTNPEDPENPEADIINFTSNGIVYRVDNVSNVATVVGLTEDAKATEKYKEKLIIPGVLEINGKNIVVNTIGEGAFQNISLKMIDLPNTITKIEKDAFNGAKELLGAILPRNVETIEERAFANCNDLNYIYIPSTATQISPNMLENDNYVIVYGYQNSQAEIFESSLTFTSAFYPIDNTEGKGDCVVDGFIYKLNAQNSTATVVGTKDNVTFVICNNYKPVKIPTKITVNGKDYYVKTIGEHAINMDCNDIGMENCEEIEVGYGVETIEKNAFTNYSNLKFIKIPETVSNIDLEAFSGIGTSTYTVEISSKNPHYACEDFVLYNKNKSVLYGKLNTAISDFIVPESVEEIKSYTAKSITIGKNVTKIEKGGVKANEIRGYLYTCAHEYAYENSILFVRLYEEGEFEFSKDNFNFTNSSEYFVDNSSSQDSEDAYRLVKYDSILENSLKQEIKDCGMKEGSWVGSCKGMVIATELFKKGILTPEFWQIENKGAECTYEIEAPNVNENIRDLINFYQVFQNYIVKGTIIERTKNVEEMYKCVNEYYSDEKNKYGMLELGYYYDKNGEIGAHAVLAIGEPENLDDKFFRFHSSDLSNYSYRIPIYDPNMEEINYLYIDENFSVISKGDENSINAFKMNADEESEENGKIYKMTISKLNIAKVLNLEETIKEGGKIGKEDGFTFIKGRLKSSITISNEEGETIDINGETLETNGNLNADVDMVIGDTVDGVGTTKYYSVALDGGEKYYVETKNDTDVLDVSIQFGDSYMTAKTEAGGKAIFENKKSVNLTNPTGKEYEVKLTLNDDFITLPWYTITATGTTATEVKLEMTSEGAIISADNLENITINGNNSNENVELNVSTKENKILIKANSDGTKLMAYVDKNGDGIFETPLKVDEVRNLAVDAIDEGKENGQSAKNEENVQTGDGIVFAIIAFLMAVVLIFCINLKN
ncbi:MAG: leucine-rich repeat protein [Clostridia bacterium]|nr:leucine-rich repeat protein [Clostridia bacterium]